MLIKLNEYKGKLRDAGERVTNEEIASDTGINLRTVENISRGELKEFRGEYIDAFAAYFARRLGVPIDQIDLIQPEPIALPLALNIRPDRHGKRVGVKGEATPTPTPPPAPVSTALRSRERGALTPPDAGPVDAARQAVLEERRRALLAQAGQP